MRWSWLAGLLGMVACSEPVAIDLVFIVQPSDVVPGQPFAPVVQVALVDAQGAPVASATDAVTLLVGTNPPTYAPPGTDPTEAKLGGPTSVRAVQGIATFSGLSVDRPGTYTLVARSGVLQGRVSPNLHEATSAGFGVHVTFASLSAGTNHTCGVTTDGVSYCWGLNASGELGDATTTDRPTPAPIAGALDLAAVGAGFSQTCGLEHGGRVYCWGLVGDSVGPEMTPVPISGSVQFTSVATGRDAGGAACGVSTSGAVYCWDSRLLPVPVSGGLSFATVSVGGRHTCGVTTDGFAYCWGSNGYGELGEGDTTFQPSPVAVAGGLRFASVSAGMIHSCGLTTSGTVYCWGFNADGQLGDSTTDDRLSPVPVAGGHTFTSVSAGSYHTCAVTTGGDAYCWGDDELGQLGDGTNGTQREAPVLVLGALTFASVTAGYAQTCGLTTDHVAYCWGSGGSGQLGSSPSGRSLVPTRVVQ